MMVEAELDTPCTRLGAEGDALCSLCKRRAEGETGLGCYRRGRAVRRLVQQRAALAAVPSQPRTIWDALERKERWGRFSSLTDALKRHYGPKWEGRYCDVRLARELELYELRRSWLPGRPKPRKWDDICRGLGLKLGEDPFHAFFYASRPLFGLVPKEVA